MQVVDTSAIVAALAGHPPAIGLAEQLVSDPELHAPHLIDVGFIHALRRLVMNGDLSEHRAQDCRADFADLTMVRYPHGPLADRMWELRHNLTAYDSAFVALSEVLGVPLVPFAPLYRTLIGAFVAAKESYELRPVYEEHVIGSLVEDLGAARVAARRRPVDTLGAMRVRGLRRTE